MATYALSWLLSGALLAVAAVVGVVLRRRSSRLQQLAAKMPGPPGAPLLGNASFFANHQEELMPMLSGLLKQYGDVVRLWLGPELNVVVADPDDLKMLLSSPKNSVKGPSYNFMAEHIGGGILSGSVCSNSGPAWRRHRKLASPNYGKRAIESYEGVFLRESSLLVERLRRETGRELDVYRQLVRTTSYSVCQTLMALNKEETMNLPHIHELIYMTDRFYTAVFARMTKWWYQFNLFYRFTGTYAFSMKFRKMSREFSVAILENRSRALRNMDLSSANLDTEEDSMKNTELGVIDRFILSNELDSEELINETYTIFTSSQEASAKIASYMLLMLAYHPEYQERLFSEIVTVTGRSGRDDTGPTLTASALRRMKYLDCVFKECVRLFPIGAVIQRTLSEECKISTHTLPAGCSLVAPIYQLSRDPRYWEHPDDFYPDHFSPESVAARPANSFLSFSVGPMDCLGRYYGTKLIKMLVVDVAREFRLTSNQTYKDLKLKIAVSIAPTDGFKLILHPRN